MAWNTLGSGLSGTLVDEKAYGSDEKLTRNGRWERKK
jgi:hypothetical protein